MKFDVPSNVMTNLFNQGYEEQIVDIALACENMPNTAVSDIPLSPTKIPTSGEKIIISPSIYETYYQLVQRISNPETAKEIPFFLLGNKQVIDGQEYVVFDNIVANMDRALSETHVSTSVEEFQNLLQDQTHSVISIGHTHGNVSEELKTSTLARKLPTDIVEKYGIRDAGLNVSVSDVWQHEAFKQIAGQSSNKSVMQTVIMS